MSKFFCIPLLLLFSFSIFAQTKTYTNEAGFQTDNDGYLGTGSDRYYTAGDFLFFRHALKVNDSSALMNKVLGFELGQKIYTPQSAFIPSSIYIDRPFAGYLYLAPSLNLLYKDESNLKLEAQIGVIGPHAFGEQVQDLIHSAFGFYTPTGWQYQIQDAFQLNLYVYYNRLLARGNFIDVSLASYANAGTGLDGAGAGFLFRIGQFNQLFNSVSTTSTVLNNNKVKPLHRTEAFFYYKPLINLVAYDATIQGGLFESQLGPNETTATKRPVIFSQQAGGQFVKDRWVIDLSAIYETAQTVQMTEVGNNYHAWGSLSVMYRFN